MCCKNHHHISFWLEETEFLFLLIRGVTLVLWLLEQTNTAIYLMKSNLWLGYICQCEWKSIKLEHYLFGWKFCENSPSGAQFCMVLPFWDLNFLGKWKEMKELIFVNYKIMFIFQVGVIIGCMTLLLCCKECIQSGCLKENAS